MESTCKRSFGTNNKFCHLFLLLSFVFLVSQMMSADGQKRYYITRYGACKDCAYRGKSYQWCKLGTGRRDWDYCSTTPGYSSRNKACKADHPCGFHGENYYWCYLKEGSWDYCSLIEESSVFYHTLDNQLCQNYCNIELDGYYYCRKEDGNEAKCSLLNGLMAKGTPCKGAISPPTNDIQLSEQDFCGFHGKSYNWCETLSGKENCSSPTTSETFGMTSVSRNSAPVSESPCTFKLLETLTQVFGENKALVTFVGYVNMVSAVIPRDTPLTQEEEKEGHAVIHKWHNRHNSSQLDISSAGIMENGTGWLLHREGRFCIDTDCFLNITVKREGSYSKSDALLAQVRIQYPLTGIERRGTRRLLVTGLHTSIMQRAPVWIFQENQNDWMTLKMNKFLGIFNLVRSFGTKAAEEATKAVCTRLDPPVPQETIRRNITWEYPFVGKQCVLSRNNNNDTRNNKPLIKGTVLNRTLFDGSPLAEYDTPPFVVALVFVDNMTNRAEIVCGGSVLDDRHVLTTAHCIEALDKKLQCGLKIQAWIGANNLDNFVGPKIDLDASTPVKIHPQYNGTNAGPIRSAGLLSYDVAIIQLGRSIPNHYAVHISRAWTYQTEPVTLVGFGNTDCYQPSRTMLAAQGVVLDSVDCNHQITKIGYPAYRLDGNQVCALLNDLGLARGDSGGPLFILNNPVVQIGVVSWFRDANVGQTSGSNCPDDDYPGVYMNTGPISDWIQGIVPNATFYT